MSGVEILISHPRFYWGEAGNVLSPALFVLPIPASRSSVHTGYGFVLPDQNGWSRYLHFEAAWLLVLTGLVYTVVGLLTRHFRKEILPVRGDLAWQPMLREIRAHLRFRDLAGTDGASYNLLQRLTYLGVIFGLIPLVIWTGLAMSPAFVSAVPTSVTLLGGQESARTIHFFVTLLLVVFLLVHVAMVCLAGFRKKMRGMMW